MAVDGVNNSNNNTALYTAGAAVVGGGAGAAAGWYSRPFLKDGAPTDSFMKKIEENIVETLDEDAKKMYADATENIKKIENAKNAEELKEVFKSNAAVKESGILDALLADIDAKGFEAAKAEAKKSLQAQIDSKNEMIKEVFNASWDKNAKKFVHNADNIQKEGFEAVKKAAKSIQTKYALIYGAIAAGVLGLGTLLCCGGSKKQPEQPQKLTHYEKKRTRHQQTS